ncbi:DNA polymerase III subunit gamma/tau [[Mycoplasma] gypis]|uniref:DNA polymerase III subunit gamma/tau n=1 Tax=[Mycoplasma] gypis TaxID=92404 RepID=A0ABZ2RVI0_9BACT|nr:DNA polymerase III subunit gamma/tau [[Mycoplasma] gypis]MBN0919666.1 DNA polymerase III subunit gamma/tau [[Mycoplasma] gypis]
MTDNKYIALYRQYRPKSFSEVRGQDHIVNTLKNVIETGKISHAYLFCGPRGTGKTSVAKIFAAALNCEDLNEDFESCDECKKSVEKSLDILEIDAASNTGVDDIRNLKENIDNLPSYSKYKVYIIDEVHMLSKSAWNALLKTIEEPPKHVIFILATTDPQKIPLTVLSRVQRYNFKRIDVTTIANQLDYVYKNEGIAFEPKALELIANLSNGAMRDALSMADQIAIFANSDVKVSDVQKMFGLISNQTLIEIINTINKKEIHEVLQLTKQQIDQGADIEKMIVGLINVLKDYVIYKKTNDATLISFLEVNQMSDIKLLVDKAYLLLDELITILKELKYSDIPQQTLEMGLLKMCFVRTNENTKESEVTNLPIFTDESVEDIAYEKETINTEDEAIQYQEHDSKVSHETEEPSNNIDEYFEAKKPNQSFIDLSHESIANNQPVSKIDSHEQSWFDNLANSMQNSKKSFQTQTMEINLEQADSIDDSELADLEESFTLSEPQIHINPSISAETDYEKSGEYSVQQAKKHEQNHKRINEMLSYDDIANPPMIHHRQNVEEIMHDTSEFAVNQNQITAEYSVIEEDLLNQNSQTQDYSSATEDIFGLDEVVSKNRYKDLTIDEILNLSLLAQKEKLVDKTDYKIEYRVKLTKLKDFSNPKYEKYVRLLNSMKPSLNASNFILFSTEYSQMIEQLNNYKQEKEFQEFIKEEFKRNLHIFAAEKQKMQRAIDYYMEHKEELKHRKLIPLPVLESPEDSKALKTVKELFGDILDIKKR